MKKVLILFGILIILVTATTISLGNFKIPNFIGIKTPTATINNHTFKLDVVKTQKEKQIGLSKRKSLEQNSGMLFPFEKPDFYRFWMKDMQFTIDIIYIRDGRIVTIHKNVKPPINLNERLSIYNSKEPADMVLEIKAGLSDEYNFKEKDLVKISNL